MLSGWVYTGLEGNASNASLKHGQELCRALNPAQVRLSGQGERKNTEDGC